MIVFLADELRPELLELLPPELRLGESVEEALAAATAELVVKTDVKVELPLTVTIVVTTWA